MIDLQKAPFSKRMYAFLTDLVIASILVVGLYFLLAAIVNTDKYEETYNRILHEYEEKYSVTVEFDSGCAYLGKADAEAGRAASLAVLSAAAKSAGEAQENASLTGTVTSVDLAYSSEAESVTVTIEVDKDARPVLCYRMKGDGADGVKVGDVIMVSGTLKQIEREFRFFNDVPLSEQEQKYNALPDNEKVNYKNAVNAMNADEEANNAKTTGYLMIPIIFAAGILIAQLLLEFAVPLILKDGRTLGKKLFGVGVMRRNCLRIGAPSVFLRGVIGKGVFELILPVMLLFTWRSGITGWFGLIALGVVLIAEVVSLIKSKTGAFLHDVLADTVVVDWASQAIFDTVEERDAFEKRLKEAAEENKLY